MAEIQISVGEITVKYSSDGSYYTNYNGIELNKKTLHNLRAILDSLNEMVQDVDEKEDPRLPVEGDN